MEPLHRGTNTKKQSSSRLELMQETAGSVDYAHGPGVSKRYMQYKEAQFKKKQNHGGLAFTSHKITSWLLSKRTIYKKSLLLNLKKKIFRAGFYNF